MRERVRPMALHWLPRKLLAKTLERSTVQYIQICYARKSPIHCVQDAGSYYVVRLSCFRTGLWERTSPRLRPEIAMSFTL